MTKAEAASVCQSLSLEIARVTETAAVAAARWRGRGNEMGADSAAVQSMYESLKGLAIDGRVVIGEGEEGEAEVLYVGERLGQGGPAVDLAADPLEGTTVCAKALPDALAVLAVAEPGSLLAVPPVYMDKIAIGPGYAPGLVDLNRSPAENIKALAQAKGVGVEDVTACILDRPRHSRLIAEVRETGAAIRLIGDGDIAGIIHVTEPGDTGIDIYLGVGGAPEGVLAAAALRCTGGQMQGRLIAMNTDDRAQVTEATGGDPERIYTLDEMASGDVVVAATGVTGGSFLDGVKFAGGAIVTHTVILHAASHSVRWLRSEHRSGDLIG